MRADDSDDEIGRADRDAKHGHGGDDAPGGASAAAKTTELQAPQDAGRDVLTVGEAAKFLGVGRNALYDAIGRGEVPHRRVGKRILLSLRALKRWLEGRAP